MTDSNSRRPSGWIVLAVLLVGALYAWGQWRGAGAPRTAEPGGEAIAEAFRERRSGLWVQAEGTVTAILPDDREGSRHQRFILRLSSGQTLLISHNIDLAPRVPLREGDTVAFRGEYEWNEEGGVIHWTHHDPSGRRPGGWLRHGGRTFR